MQHQAAAPPPPPPMPAPSAPPAEAVAAAAPRTAEPTAEPEPEVSSAQADIWAAQETLMEALILLSDLPPATVRSEQVRYLVGQLCHLAGGDFHPS